nr:retrotransposon protein, putative, unclassified [Tanacetum cinerariifolium]
MFRINPFKTFREEKYVPNKVRASVRTNPIIVSQPHVIIKKDVNSDSNGLSSTGVDNTAKTKRPLPKSNTKNGRVPSASKSSCSKNKEVEVEEHPRNLLLSKNKKYMSSECNNVELTIQNDKSKVVCAMCCSKHMTRNLKILINFVWKFLGTVRFGNDHVAAILGLPKFKYHKEHLYPSYEQGKSKRATHPPRPVPNSKQRLHLLHMDLCGPMRITSINGKRKLGAKGDIGFFIGYSADSCAYIVYNLRTKKIIKTMNDVDRIETLQQHAQQQENQALVSLKIVVDNVPIAMFDDNTFVNLFATPSTSAAKSSSSQYLDPSNILRGYRQEEGIDFEGSFVLVARMEAIMIFLAYAAHKSFTVFQMDMKTTFLHGKLKEDVYVHQLEGFIDADHPSEVYKLKKALYGLKQAPKAWYDEFSMFLLHNHFFKGTIDLMLFIRGFDDDILMIKDKLDLDQNGSPANATKYHSMIGALMYLTSSRPDIVHATCLCARYQAKPTEKHLKEVKSIFHNLRGTVNMGLWYTKDSSFDLSGFSDADYVGYKDTFKGTSSGAQFSGKKLVSWSLKKQDCMALSTVEAEYVSLFACCAQVLRMRTQLTDYGFHFNKISIYCDSKSSMAISCNPVQHSRKNTSLSATIS